MANMNIGSHICVRIVLAFLHFLSFVQVASPEQTELIKGVVKSLKEIFKITPDMIAKTEQETRKPGLLVTLFSRPQYDAEDLEESDDDDEPCSSSSVPPANEPSSSKGAAVAAGRNIANLQGVFKSAVLKHGSLESLFFGHVSNPKKKINAIAGKIFNEALGLIFSKEGCSRFDLKDVAESLRTLGNKAMETNYYTKAAEYYSCAIAIDLDNATHYYNRGAALSKIGKYHEAIVDCYKAIRLNPTYLKAYYRLGLVFSEQGKYMDAICEGFLKVLQQHPKNKAAIAQLELNEGKLSEQISWLDDQLEDLRKKGVIRRCRKMPKYIKEGTKLVYKGKAADGVSHMFHLIEDDVDPNAVYDEILSINEFMELISNTVNKTS